MNKGIQYREDGKFYGLVNVPEKPQPQDKYDNSDSDGYAFRLKLHQEKLNVIIAAGKEIINPEVAVNSEVPFCMNSSGQWIHVQTCVLLKPGEIFDCPDNIEFEDEWKDPCQSECDNEKELNTACKYRCEKRNKVIRLKFKEEAKLVETQGELWNSIVGQIHGDKQIRKMSVDQTIEQLKSKFTIQRNKNGNE